MAALDLSAIGRSVQGSMRGSQPELVTPTAAAHRSFLAAWDEFGADGGERTGAGIPGRRWSRLAAEDSAGFRNMVDEIRAVADPATPLLAEFVHETVLWLVDGEEWLGRIVIRHRLTPALQQLGGHIGYAVRPSARRRGYATQMLTKALPVASSLGINPVLLTCDAANYASLRVIESAGGRALNPGGEVLRFWMPTTAAAR